ncbi:MAG: PqqD family protein [Acidimicrobiales bacterium]
MIDASTPVRRHPRVVFRELSGDGGGVVLHLGSASYHGVNGIGALIFSLLDEAPTVGALIESVRGRLEDAPPELDADLTAFIAALAERQLILVGGEDVPAPA